MRRSARDKWKLAEFGRQRAPIVDGTGGAPREIDESG